MENERLKNSLNSAVKLTRKNLSEDRHISQMHRQKKTMPSMHGIWLS